MKSQFNLIEEEEEEEKKQLEIENWRNQFPLYAGKFQTDFGRDTMANRVPSSIGKRILLNQWTEEIEKNLKNLFDGMPNSKLKKISQDGGEDVEEWNSIIEPYLSCNWIETPWYIAESYFYRRVMEIIHFFTTFIDPFSQEKYDSLTNSETAYRTLASTLTNLTEPSLDSFRNLIYHSLFANRADLSMWKPNEVQEKSKSKIEEELHRILVNDTEYLWNSKMLKLRDGNIHFVLDNAGLETVTDLFFCDYLLRFQFAKSITLYLKKHPFFVSDSMIKDINNTLQYLISDSSEQVQQIAKRLEKYIKEGSLQMNDDYFWTLGYHFHQIPKSLCEKLKSADLVIAKGDLNYRRLLGERHYPFTTSFAQVVNYFPVSVLALRTNKSDIIVGLELNQIDQVSKEDRDWLTNGKYGVIQYSEKKN